MPTEVVQTTVFLVAAAATCGVTSANEVHDHDGEADDDDHDAETAVPSGAARSGRRRGCCACWSSIEELRRVCAFVGASLSFTSPRVDGNGRGPLPQASPARQDRTTTAGRAR